MAGWRRVALAAMTWVSVTSCGGSAQAGGSCNKDGYECQDINTALECRSGTWLALPCRGQAGCTVSGGIVSCDSSADRPGDPCASSAAGKGECTAQGSATLECRPGADGGLLWVQTNTCTSCAVSNGEVSCQQ